jgi:hypothetical protein
LRGASSCVSVVVDGVRGGRADRCVSSFLSPVAGHRHGLFCGFEPQQRSLRFMSANSQCRRPSLGGRRFCIYHGTVSMETAVKASYFI